MTVGAGAFEHRLTLTLQAVERRIGIGQLGRLRANGVCQRPNTMVREEYPLERRQIVEHSWRGELLNLRVIHQRSQRLLLQRAQTRVELVPARRIRVARPDRAAVVRPGERRRC
jgi:hypothetical protein